MGTLEIDTIKDFLISVGCKIEYPILVNAFKKHLYNPDPSIQSRIRNKFKDDVNRLSTVSVENNMKFINLRPEFRPSPGRPISLARLKVARANSDAQHPHKPSHQPMRLENNRLQPSNLSNDMKAMRPIKQHQVLRSASIQHNFVGSPLRTQSQSFQIPLPPTPGGDQYQHQIPISNHCVSHSTPPPPVPLRGKWTMEACNCNYNNLCALLREDPKLAACKDIIIGYTALHWAAKFGNRDIIKLIAGTCRVSVNIKSSAGHTPLHIAYMFNRLEVADLLLNGFHADKDIRDHSGKKPRQYLRGSQ